MPYNLYIFEPDRDETGQIQRYHRVLTENPDLLARINRDTSGANTPQIAKKLEKVAAAIGGDVYANHDRMLRVPVSVEEIESKQAQLIDIAMQYQMALATRPDNFIFCYGDENPEYTLYSPYWYVPGLSYIGLQPGIEWVRTQTYNNQFLILRSSANDQDFCQWMLKDVATDYWWFEFRDLEFKENFGVTCDGFNLVKLIWQWHDRSPAFVEHEWSCTTANITQKPTFFRGPLKKEETGFLGRLRDSATDLGFLGWDI